MALHKKYPEILLSAAYVLVAAFTIHRYGGTGDLGDSIQHYLTARYAPKHPELYFDHWAKPVYVLLASPFAQFGITGIKVFNALVTGLVLLITFRCAKKLGYIYPLLAPVFVWGMPLYFILTFSGLTEPLFALFGAAGLYLCLQGRYKTAAVVVSFMPFVRSEGLIIAGVFGLYFLYRRQWQAVLLLATGHVAYSAAGYFVFGNFLWVFTQIPYAHADNYYGRGSLTHYVEQLYYIIGLPIYVLLVLGLLSLALPWVNPKKYRTVPEELILMAGGFLLFLLAHTLFWHFGLFRSMGIKRVMLGVAPFMALLALRGFHLVLMAVPDRKKQYRPWLTALLVSAGFILLCSDHPTGIHPEKTLQPDLEQMQARRIPELLATFPQKPRMYLFSHPYVAEVLGIDPFDPAVHKPLTRETLQHVQPYDVVIWDRHFSVMENHITRNDLLAFPLQERERLVNPDGEPQFVIYQAVF